MNSPSSTPPAPPSTSRPNDKRGCMIALVVGLAATGLIIAIGVVAAVVIPNLSLSPGAETARKLERAPKLDDAMKPALLDFAQELVDAISEGDVAGLHARCDYEAHAARAFDGLNASGIAGVRLRQGFLEGLAKRGFFSEVMDAKLKPLRVHERDGLPAVTLRILPATGGVNYADILVWKREDGFRVVDLHTYLFGTLNSAESRDLLASALAKDDREAFAKMLGVGGAQVEAMLRGLADINEKVNARDHEGILEVYRAQPESFQKMRVPFTRYLIALQELNAGPEGDRFADGYREALRKAPAVFGSDATTDLLLVDELIMAGSHDAAIDALKRVDQAVGGDPYLHVLRGWIYFQQEKMADVMRCIALAGQEEPDLVEAVDLKLSFHAKSGDHAALVRELKDFQIQFGTRLTREDLAEDPQYEAFLLSPEFAAYEKQGE